MFDPSQPHNSLPPLGRMTMPTREQLIACNMPAYVELARLQEAIKHLPDPQILLSGACIMEAVDSSKIENIVTTGDALFRHEALPALATDAATKQVHRYPLAVRQAAESMRSLPLCFRSANEICSVLLATQMDLRRGPVSLRNDRTGEVAYTPPDQPDVLMALLADWERFVHQVDDLDPLSRIAIAHCQFVAIHPFSDGNGRTARVLHSMMLMDQGLLSEPVLYLSRFLLAQRQNYYGRLKGVERRGDWLSWIAFVGKVTAEAARHTYRVVGAIRTLHASTKQLLSNSAPSLNRSDVLNVLFRQPYCRVIDVQNARAVNRGTAGRYLKRLEDLGVLRAEQVGRDKVWRHGALLRALEG